MSVCEESACVSHSCFVYQPSPLPAADVLTRLAAWESNKNGFPNVLAVILQATQDAEVSANVVEQAFHLLAFCCRSGKCCFAQLGNLPDIASILTPHTMPHRPLKAPHGGVASQRHCTTAAGCTQNQPSSCGSCKGVSHQVGR